MTTLQPVPTRKRVRFGVWRYSFVELLAALIALFAVTPFVEDLPRGDLIEGGIMTLVLISALLAVGGRRKVFGFALLLLVPTIIAKWTHHSFPHLFSPTAYLACGLFFIGFVVANILGFILRASQVDAEVLCAGVSVYLLIGLLWAMAYVLLGGLAPDAFSFANEPSGSRTMTGFNAFYFSFTTMSTVGFGDITPVSKVARTLAVLEAITGMFYVAVLISRLVAMYSLKRPESNDNSTQP